MQKISRAAARYAASSSTPILRPRYPTHTCLAASAPLRCFSASARRVEDSKVRGTVADRAAVASSSAETPSAHEVVQGLGLEMPEGMDEAEKAIWVKLRDGLGPSKLRVQDVSGGCGSMYAIDIESEAFRGLGMLKQQRLVNQTIGEEIKGWHGVQLRTKAP